MTGETYGPPPAAAWHLSPAERAMRDRLLAEGYTLEEADDAILASRPAHALHPAMTAPPVPLGMPSGALAYGLGFLAYLPIPFFSLVIAGVTMAAVYPSQRRKSPLAAENARQAANWGLTLVAATVAMLVLVLLLVVTRPEGSTGPGPAVPLLLIFPLGVAHLVVVIVGLVRANQGTVFRNPLAIPFLR
ncbi:DUF4870 domain-containing protein [Oerskovia flava]|uniref:DUF4870 domain-containing protein n=1 Tax=Oerskovia flava TaxID=2986422 RepID=UPI00223FCB28|nr:DUF4870 domain-containing protein [Oerskovia sp. JB1-3-2]